MKFFALISIILVVLGLVQGLDKVEVLDILNTFNTAAVEQCTKDGKTFNKGQTYQPQDKCELYECYGKNGMIVKSCPIIDSLKPCKYIPQDNTKEYPKCCAHQKC